MKFKSLQGTGFLYIELCADRMMQASGLDENTLLEQRGEGRACALTMEHVHRRTDDPAFSYNQIADSHLCRVGLIRSSKLSRPLSAARLPLR